MRIHQSSSASNMTNLSPIWTNYPSFTLISFMVTSWVALTMNSIFMDSTDMRGSPSKTRWPTSQYLLTMVPGIGLLTKSALLRPTSPDSALSSDGTV